MRLLTQSNREFDRIRDAFRDARNQGYGIAPPSLEEMSLDQPEIVRIKYLVDELEGSPEKLWGANIFGKSLHHLVRDGIQNKLLTMPDNAQEKLRECLQRIINEGSGGLIAIIL
ncbi:MAG: Stage IV sporulation protein A [Firmicutes bacterium]|nr:Stage IV sporulation protein A [Bacillota bacterium]